MLNDKRGQGLSINTVILIILGVIVLVLLIVGFTAGWDKVFPFLNPGNNIKEVSDSCSIACSTNSQFDYCSVARTVRDGTNEEFDATCNDLATDSVYAGRNYGINPCSTVTCA